MMDCVTWQEMLVDLLAGELSEEKAILLEQHLAECRGCSAAESELRHLFSSARASEEWTSAPEMEQRLLRVMRQMEPEQIEAESGKAAAAPAAALQGADKTGPPRAAQPSPLLRCLHVFLRPVPAYITAALLLVTATAAFIMGSLGGTSEHSLGPGAHLPAAASRSAVHGRQLYAGDPLQSGPPSTTRVELATALTRWQNQEPSSRFVPAPSDAIQIPGWVMGDSL